MNEFSIFHHEKFGDIRATEENGITWFVGIDVCNALGYKNARKAINDHVNNVDRNTVTIRYGIQRGNPNMTIINESGLYSLIMSSQLPAAQEFKHWVTGEVLPTIRKTGHYDMNGQSNSVFDSINKLEEHAINGSDRTVLNDLVKMYAKMSSIHVSSAWIAFEHCYNNAYSTNLAVSRRSYEKKYNNGKSISNPKYLEATGNIDKAIAVANQMIDERHSMIIQNEKNIRHVRDMEMARNVYANQFVQYVQYTANSMNYRTEQSKQTGAICILFADVSKEYRQFISLRYPFSVNIEAAYNYAYEVASNIYK